MNNDVAGKLNSKFNAPKNNAASNSIKKIAAQKTNSSNSSDAIDKTMNFMGTLGVAQIGLNKDLLGNVKKSTNEFLKNPDYTEAHVAFCDSLVENGYKLEEAIETTDSIFETLKQKETY